MKYIYRIYQLFVCLPILLLVSIITSLVTIIGCVLGDGHFWGYFPGKYWSRLWIRLLLLPVKVDGREHLAKNQSYVFVSNHQGAFDIFLIYGYLNRNFKWMMKKSLRKVPFVGMACEYAHHIFVDKSGPSKIKASYDHAREQLQEGMSLVVFPEGARSLTGEMGPFRRGAFMLADELQLPVCPLTINGSYDVKPRTKDLYWVFWHPLRLTIHEPIQPIGKGPDNVKNQMERSYQAIMDGLESKYKRVHEKTEQ